MKFETFLKLTYIVEAALENDEISAEEHDSIIDEASQGVVLPTMSGLCKSYDGSVLEKGKHFTIESVEKTEKYPNLKAAIDHVEALGNDRTVYATQHVANKGRYRLYLVFSS